MEVKEKSRTLLRNWIADCYRDAREIIEHNVILIVVFNAQYDLGRHGFISAARRTPNLGQYAIGFRVLYATQACLSHALHTYAALAPTVIDTDA